MGDEWTNKNQILRDLFVAQGRKVPVEVDGTLAGGKPRIPYVREETEQEYVDDYLDDGDFHTGPDLHLIRNMLDMVRENEEQNYNLTTERGLKGHLPQNKESSCEETILVISKCDTKKTKKKKRRNIAIASLLEAYGDNNSQVFNDHSTEAYEDNNSQVFNDHSTEANSDNNSQVLAKLIEPIKLMKPNDFMVDNSKKEMVKLSDRLRSNPASMFRKRTDVKQEKTPEKGTELNNRNNYGQDFIPSSIADEYYNACVERTKIKQIVREELWPKAESQMKEMDEKRKVQIAHLAGKSNPEELCDMDIKKFSKICLSAHRHLSTAGECIVCKQLCKTENP